MKIAIVLARFDPAHGGLECYASDWARWLSAHGHEVHVVALGGIEGMQGIRLHAIGERTEDVLARAGRLTAKASSLVPDVMHDFGDGLGGHIFHPVGGSRAAGEAGELRSLDPARRLKRRLSPGWRRHRALLQELERRQLQHSRGLFVACSDLVAGDLQSAGASQSRIRVVYNAVDQRRFAPVAAERKRSLREYHGLPAEGVLFLQVAHNFRLKGVSFSLRAMARLINEGNDCRLAVIGRGPNLGDYQRQAASLGIAARCHFLGAVDDTVPLYAAADALVHPAFYDSCSLACLEAWASGLPVAVSRFDGVSGLMTEGVQGWLIRDPGDPAEIAFRMKEMLDPGRREAMGAQARVLAEFNNADSGFSRLETLCLEAAGRAG